MQYIQNIVQDNVKRIMSEQLHNPSTALNHQKNKADFYTTKPTFVASCSVFGPKVNYKLVSGLLVSLLTHFFYYSQLLVMSSST
jgi:urease accessory protein